LGNTTKAVNSNATPNRMTTIDRSIVTLPTTTTSRVYFAMIDATSKNCCYVRQDSFRMIRMIFKPKLGACPFWQHCEPLRSTRSTFLSASPYVLLSSNARFRRSSVFTGGGQIDESNPSSTNFLTLLLYYLTFYTTFELPKRSNGSSIRCIMSTVSSMWPISS
jgi:hypothetical protein